MEINKYNDLNTKLLQEFPTKGNDILYLSNVLILTKKQFDGETFRFKCDGKYYIFRKDEYEEDIDMIDFIFVTENEDLSIFVVLSSTQENKKSSKNRKYFHFDLVLKVKKQFEHERLQAKFYPYSVMEIKSSNINYDFQLKDETSLCDLCFEKGELCAVLRKLDNYITNTKTFSSDCSICFNCFCFCQLENSGIFMGEKKCGKADWVHNYGKYYCYDCGKRSACEICQEEEWDIFSKKYKKCVCIDCDVDF